MRFWPVLLSLCLILSAGLGLLVLSGQARGLFAPALEAELTVQDFPVPQDFGVNPERVAGYMSDQLKKRMDEDVAMRVTLKPDVMKKLRDIVLPRLLNVTVVQGMMHDIPELSAMLDIASFRRSLTGTVRSKNAADDVALTVPGALLAEVDGAKVKVLTASTGMQVVPLGTMAPGQTHQITVWMNEAAQKVDLGRTVLLGASDGQRGRVLLWGDHGWFGADMEPLRWARWLVGAILAGVLLAGLSGLILTLARRWP
jgi:hypothetical protein